MHLLIPYASSQSAGCQQALANLKLPHLDKLLRQLTLVSTDSADDNTLIPPHERALGAAYGISTPGVTPDGQVPWGAWHAAQAGQAVVAGESWAVITPCHWAVQTNHITMISPRDLNLLEDESRALLAAMQPYFAEDGIALVYDTPTRWLAQASVFAGLATASPYRVVGARVDDWMPKGDSTKNLRRLQQEMQMLLYTHPLTDARTDQGLLAVNSFWVSGTGALPAQHPVPAGTWDRPASPVIAPPALRDAAVRDDWAAWAQAWQHIDATECAALLATLHANNAVTLTLCGGRSAHSFQTPADAASPGARLQQFLRQIKGFFGTLPSSNLLVTL
jgi:hypothetical protein